MLVLEFITENGACHPLFRKPHPSFVTAGGEIIQKTINNVISSRDLEIIKETVTAIGTEIASRQLLPLSHD